MSVTIETIVSEGIRYARAGERIICALDQLDDLAASINALADLSPSALPELDGVTGHLSEAAQGLVRAQKFLATRLGVIMDGGGAA